MTAWPRKQPPRQAGKAAKSARPRRRSMTKSAIYAELAEKTDLTKQADRAVFDALFDLIKREVASPAPASSSCRPA